MTISPSIEFVLNKLPFYFRKPISRDTVVEKSMLTTAADFIDQSVIMIRGFVVKQQEELSSTNVHNVNKIEELRKRLVKQ